MPKWLPEGDCGKRDAGRGLWEKGCRKWTVGKGMPEGDCGKRDAGRGLWEKGCRNGTVGKERLGGDEEAGE